LSTEEAVDLMSDQLSADSEQLKADFHRETLKEN
jgi:hypothetical protein